MPNQDITQDITNDELALMIKEGFDSVDKQFGEVDKRFDEVDKRFDEVDKRFGEVDKRFDAVDKRFDKIEERLERVELVHITDHRKRIERLEDEAKAVKLKLAPA